jgi:geranylgeranyl pyrophosphate synthase
VTLAAYLDDLRGVVNEALDRVFHRSAAPPLIVEAMRYALLGGGKRLRPCLTLAASEAVAPRVGLSPAEARLKALPNACGVELVHCYSLVHDDLPAMDDDTLRRGRPTTHVTFGDGVAVLAGDGLLTEAFAVVAASPSPVTAPGSPQPSADARLRSVQMLAAAAGGAGMVGGQTIDLAAAGRVLNREPVRLDAPALEDMHARKTGALIRAAATLGAAAVDADQATLQAIDVFARDLGLAFQIVDDVLDVEGSAAEIGKTSGKDAAAHKVTYPSLYGVEASRRLAAECIERARAALAAAALDGRLGEIADWSLGRRQ